MQPHALAQHCQNCSARGEHHVDTGLIGPERDLYISSRFQSHPHGSFVSPELLTANRRAGVVD